MSDADWDADDFERNFEIKPVSKGKWDDEDEEDEVKDNWDDDEDVDEEKVEPKKTEVVVAPKKPKKLLKDKIAEKEKQKELEKKSVVQPTLTPKEMFEERMRREREQKQSDLELMLDTLGVISDAGEIDLYDPRTKEDFTKFTSLLTKKIENYKSSPCYVAFLENLFRDLVAGVEVDGMRKISNSLTSIYNEKLKLVKATKPKKKAAGKAKLKMERDGDLFNEDEAVGYEDDD